MLRPVNSRVAAQIGTHQWHVASNNKGPLALKIFQGEFRDGNVIRADVDGQGLTFTPMMERELVG
jgi:hypothetical protein